MKILLFTLGLLIFTVTVSIAQHTRTVELKPIHKQGSKYFYDFKRVNSGFALQIPLLSLEDEEVNRRFRRYSTYQGLRGVGYAAWFIYLITSSNNAQWNTDVTFTMLVASIAADIAFSTASHHQLKRAAERYNILIMTGNPVGSNDPTKQNGIGIKLSYRFR